MDSIRNTITPQSAGIGQGNGGGGGIGGGGGQGGGGQFGGGEPGLLAGASREHVVLSASGPEGPCQSGGGGGPAFG